MKPGRKPAVCTKCGKLLLGSILLHEEVTCYFCENPRHDDEDDSTILRSRDKAE
jgi:hypothetical protein